jgi:hypothetical protein
VQACGGGSPRRRWWAVVGAAAPRPIAPKGFTILSGRVYRDSPTVFGICSRAVKFDAIADAEDFRWVAHTVARGDSLAGYRGNTVPEGVADRLDSRVVVPARVLSAHVDRYLISNLAGGAAV